MLISLGKAVSSSLKKDAVRFSFCFDGVNELE